MAKAEAVTAQYPDDVVLAADTIVCLGEQVMGKPADAADAKRMLELLSGTTQIIITGICVVRKSADLQQSSRVMSAVRMDNLTDEQIKQYVASGDWEGKAGGYGIQDHDPFVKRVAGSHTNIVGMPMEFVRKMLARTEFPCRISKANERSHHPASVDRRTGSALGAARLQLAIRRHRIGPSGRRDSGRPENLSSARSLPMMPPGSRD